MNLFAYGTLLDRRVTLRLLGRSLPPPVPATLRGYRKWETTLGYPIILPESGASTPGFVLFGLTDADWKRLDAYEGVSAVPPNYFRRMVSVEGAHGLITVQAYIGNLNFFRTRMKK